MLTFPILNPRKRHDRRKTMAASPPSPPPPPTAHAVSVGADGSNFAIWSFDQPVDSITDATGLACPSSGAVVGATVTGTTTVAVEYEFQVNGGGGDVWECTAAAVVMTFADGATLEDGTGFIAGS